jgi:putative phosphoesterase
MRVGILSDSHGHAAATREAVSALRERGAEMLIHLGDIGTEAVIDELIAAPCRIVFGNCDFDVDGLRRHAEAMEVQVDHPLGRLEVGGRVIAFTHGDRPRLMDGAIDDGVDYLLHGHTHEIRDDRQGRTRVINPGALFRAARYTAALLDPGRDRLEILEIRPTAR